MADRTMTASWQHGMLTTNGIRMHYVTQSLCSILHRVPARPQNLALAPVGSGEPVGT
jgi:hypothetical protein